MKVMFTFNTTEDYIVDTEDIKETQKIIKMIWEHKQSTQKDLIIQYNITSTQIFDFRLSYRTIFVA